MPAIRCPHCSIFLLDHEARGSTCPGCYKQLGNDAITTASTAPRAGSSAPWFGLVACGGLLVLGLVGLVAFLAWPRVKPVDPGDYKPVARPNVNPRVVLPFPHIEAASDSLLDPPHVELLEPPIDNDHLLPPPRVEPIVASPPID